MSTAAPHPHPQPSVMSITSLIISLTVGLIISLTVSLDQVSVPAGVAMVTELVELV